MFKLELNEFACFESENKDVRETKFKNFVLLFVLDDDKQQENALLISSQLG